MTKKAGKTPWLGKRDDRYYVFWRDREAGRTKRLSLRTDDQVEAEHRYAAFLTEGRAITHPTGGSALTVPAALDDYYREHVALKCADPGRQEIAIEHLKAFYGDRPVAEIDIPRSRAYADARRTGRVGGGKKPNRIGSDSTIRRELSVLLAAANHARRWKRIKEMPSVELPSERRLGEDEQARYFERSEVNMLIDLANGELQQFVELAYWTGARRRSIENLTRDQVKWDQKRLILMPPGKRVTKKRQPIVPILPRMEPALTKLWDQGGDPRLFRCADFYRPFRDLCERVGMVGRSNPHLLRHSRATHLLQAGKSIYTVARLLGDTVATVERVYGHHAADYIAEEIGDE